MRLASGRTDPKAVRCGGERGQGLVEFSLVLTPLFLVLLGIVQFGFIFNTYVTLTNATRDAARQGTIVIYDRSISKDQNDLARNEAVKDALQDQLHIMGEAARDFLEPQRIALTGRLVSTGIYESLALIGRDEAFRRYRETLGRLAELWAAA